VLSRYVDAIMIRILNHEALLELAAHATVPVINGLTRRSHPCQVMADLMTFEEHRGPIEGAPCLDRRRQQRAGVVGACGRALQVQAQCRDPAATGAEQGDEGLDQGDPGADRARQRSGAAVRGADCVVTDTWVSMGDKDGEHRHNLLKPYQVNAKLMSLAKPDALFMHCLPAHRGEEVTDEVIDGPQSVVFDEAENRLHAQKYILPHLLNSRLWHPKSHFH
jgi:ornithine carbamoyltransferase